MYEVFLIPASDNLKGSSLKKFTVTDRQIISKDSCTPAMNILNEFPASFLKYKNPSSRFLEQFAKKR